MGTYGNGNLQAAATATCRLPLTHRSATRRIIIFITFIIIVIIIMIMIIIIIIIVLLIMLSMIITDR